MTHEQMAALIYRYAQAKGMGFQGLWSFKLNYADAGDISDWAVEAVSWLAMVGNSAGLPETETFAPQAPCTRAEAAGLLCRFLAA